jgi:fructokinase
LSEQDVIHFGSLAAFRPPGADALEPWLDRQRRIGTVISFDPNLRPAALGADHPAALVRLHRLASLAHLIKVSQEDLALADPSRSAESLVDQWLGAGVRLVVLTEGAAGLAGFHDADVHRVPALDVPVVDTIGAGDAVSGALLAQLARLGIDGMLADLPAVLSYAAAVAALTCAQAGPDPPTAAQVAQMWPKRST